jgi:hypothetical protein
MTLTGKKIDDEELISYIFVELDFDYNSMVSALVARPDTLSIGEVYSQLLSALSGSKMEKAAIKPRHTRQVVVEEMFVDAWVHVAVVIALAGVT